MFDLTEVGADEMFELGKIDLFICAIGQEHRASYLSSKLKDKEILNKVCVKLLDDLNPKECKELDKLGFQFITQSQLEQFFDDQTKVIVVDYSVMMKSLYADILKFIANKPALATASVFFSYTRTMFEPPLDRQLEVENIKPILLTESKRMPNGQAKLLIGLGYERLSAIGIIEILEVAYEDVIVFINKESPDSHHYKECLRVNENFLELIRPEQIVETNFFNFNQLVSTLDSVVYKLTKNQNQVILAPMTVKPFSLISMLISLKYDGASFYNVTSVNSTPYYKKFPNKGKDPIVYQLKRLKGRLSETIV